MKRAGKEAGTEVSGLKQPRRGQAGVMADSNRQQATERQPTEREIAAAKAARARLYGGEEGAKVDAQVETYPRNLAMVSCAQRRNVQKCGCAGMYQDVGTFCLFEDHVDLPQLFIDILIGVLTTLMSVPARL